jgi:uncharacterized protein (TIGR03382 family)
MMSGLLALTIYLNPNGGTFTRARDDSRLNYASAIQYDQATVPAYAYGDASWDDVVSCVRDIYAPFDVTVTDADPGDVEHTECVVGGGGWDIGLPDVGGVASFDCAYIPNSVAFVFPEHSGDDPQRICETVAQETAHTFGLDHEYLCEDALTYLDGCGPKSFVDENASCGEYAPRPCACGGSTQNSYQTLLGVLGERPAGVAPTVSIVSPQDGAIVPPGFSIDAAVSDDSAIATVELVVDGTATDSRTAGPWSFTAPTAIGEGAHEIEVRATDADGTVASDSISVLVEVDAPPADEPPNEGGGGGSDDGDFEGGHSVGLLGCSTAPGSGSPIGLAVGSLAILARRRRVRA